MKGLADTGFLVAFVSRNDRYHDWAAYAQDQWKMTPRLTLNVGLRWEPSLPPGMLNNAAYNFSYPNLLAGVRSKTYVNAPPGLSWSNQ